MDLFDDTPTVSVAAFTPTGDAWDAPAFALVERAGDELPRIRVCDGDAVWTAADVVPPADAPPGWTDAVESVLLGRLRGGGLSASRGVGGSVRAALTWPADPANPAGVKAKAVLDFDLAPDGGRADRRAVLAAALAAADAAARAAAELEARCAALTAEAAAANDRVVAMGEQRDHDEADLFLRFSKVLNTKKAKTAEWKARAEAAEAALGGRAPAAPAVESPGVPPSPLEGDDDASEGTGVGPTATGVPPTADQDGDAEPADGELLPDNDSAGEETEDDDAMVA